MTLTNNEAAGRILLTARGALYRYVGVVILGALLPACGAPGEQEEANGNAPALEGSMELTGDSTRYQVLHEFSVFDDQKFTFIRLAPEGGAPEIMISDEFTNGLDHYAAVTERHGLLTSLETFLAFAPEGMHPHPDLVAAHESEARGLGRGDDLTVRVVDGLEPEVTIQKQQMTFPVECSATVFYANNPIRPLTWTEQGAELLVSVDNVEIFGCVGTPQVTGVGTPTGCEGYGANAMLRMYACNGVGSPSPLPTRFFSEGSIDPIGASVAPFTSRRVTRNPFQPTPGEPVIERRLSVRVKNADAGTAYIIGGMASL